MASEVVAFGDRAWLVTVGDVASAHRLATAVDRDIASGAAPPGAAETVVGLGNVVVHVHPPGRTQPGRDASSDADDDRWGRWLNGLASAPTSDAVGGDREAVELPTVFDGPDLDEVSELSGLTPTHVVDLLAGADLRVAFVGFSPGFPYLVGLPDELAAIPRRPTPRQEVPAGSVGVAGGFAGVYPQATPGGWRVVGRTDQQLFDPARAPFARLGAGDRVRFVPTRSHGRGDRTTGSRSRPRPLLVADGRLAEVLDPGLFTTVQDERRRQVAAAGVPRAGPCDAESLRLANLLVGNEGDAAGLEITAHGPRLRFGAAAHVAVVGAAPDAVDVTLDGRPAPDGAAVPVEAGQVLAIGSVREGFRAYVAVSGGIATPEIVGSRSSDVLSGLGPGGLQTGDRLGLGRPGRPRGAVLAGDGRERTLLHVVAGPHSFPHDALDLLVDTVWTVSAASSRVGLRLESATHRLPPGPDVPSTGMVSGAVQVPPDGRPIVLMPDHATVGGYPVLATVIGADLATLGQLAPGSDVRFELVEHATAVTAAWHREAALVGRVHGWYPTRPAT